MLTSGGPSTILIMETRRLWHTIREYVTHWSVAGAILAATGTAPEHWLAEFMHVVHLPHDALPSWLDHVDYRLVAVIAGLSIIVGDNLWRRVCPDDLGDVDSSEDDSRSRQGLPAADGWPIERAASLCAFMIACYDLRSPVLGLFPTTRRRPHARPQCRSSAVRAHTIRQTHAACNGINDVGAV